MVKVFVKGNEAVAEAALRAGCRFFAGYPITPQNEIPEYMARRLPEVGGVFVQGESEVASINMLFGASSVGVRCMTSSSGLGISLKTEGISYMVGARLPAVIINVMRGGPGIGSIQPAQQDYLQATKAMGSGGYRLKVFAPGSVQEAVDLTYEAFESADRDRMPAIVLMDGCVGAMMEPVSFPEYKTEFPDKSDWITLGADGREARFISSFNVASTEPYGIEDGNIAVAENYGRWLREETLVETYLTDDAEIVIVAYGIIGRESRYVVDMLRENGFRAGLVRPKTISPFPYAFFEALPQSVRAVLCAEMSIPGQMVDDVKMAVSDLSKVKSIGRSGGILLTAEEIFDKAVELLGGARNE